MIKAKRKLPETLTATSSAFKQLSERSSTSNSSAVSHFNCKTSISRFTPLDVIPVWLKFNFVGPECIHCTAGSKHIKPIHNMIHKYTVHNKGQQFIHLPVCCLFMEHLVNNLDLCLLNLTSHSEQNRPHNDKSLQVRHDNFISECSNIRFITKPISTASSQYRKLRCRLCSNSNFMLLAPIRHIHLETVYNKHSRSSEGHLFGYQSKVFYWWSIATLVLYCPFSEMLQVFCWKQSPPPIFHAKIWDCSVPTDQITDLGSPKCEDSRPIIHKITCEVTQPIWLWYLNITVRQIERTLM